jgi:hypothetical protein
MTDAPDPTRNRARNRAIQDHARQSNLPFSEAARQLDYAGVRGGEMLANHGRTVYPTATDTAADVVEARLLRSRAERLADTRRAPLPDGRPPRRSLPPGRGADGSVGPIYAGPAEDGLPSLSDRRREPGRRTGRG